MSPSEQPLVSIIIPCTDSPVIGWLLEALRPQVEQMHAAEVLVIGTDARRLVRPGGAVRFIPTGAEATCASDKRNLGMQLAQGEYFLFLDDDCIPDPGWLEGLLVHLEGGKRVVGGSVHFARQNYLQLADNLSAFHDLLPYTPPGERPYLVTANLGVQRSVVEKVGGMPPGRNRADDLEWTQRMRSAGYTLYFEPSASILHDPPRRDFPSVWQHWTGDAPHTLRVRLRYAAWLRTPRPARWRGLYLWASPLIAAWATARTYAHWRSWVQYAHALPLVYLTKLAWCWSAYASFHRLDELP